MRFDTRKMWVSTAIVGCPKAVFRMTLAVFLPTPGRASKASRFCGTTPPCFSSRRRQVSWMCLPLELNKPMCWIKGLTRSSPRSNRACGVLAILKSLRVPLFTDTSVACADSKTAMSNSKGELYSSSVSGWGLLALSCSKNAFRLSRFIIATLLLPLFPWPQQ